MATLERRVGQRVMCNGYEGTIIRVCEWSPSMVEVRVPGGVTCVGFSELQPIDTTDESLHECGECRPECAKCQTRRDLVDLGLD